MTVWVDPQPALISDDLRETVGGHPLVATALARRGVTKPLVARAFLSPNYYTPALPSELPGLIRAADRIWQGVVNGERIAVWGDFDVDGQTATALLVEAFRKVSLVVGGEPKGTVIYRVPLRTQGHGISLPALEELLEQGVTLLVTCDTGVDAFAAIERAASRDCDVVVTDHHDLPSSLPPAFAIVNPKQLAVDHPLHELPGVGVAYKLAEGLYQRAGLRDDNRAGLDLVALGVVADVAVQVADVRFLLQRGLEVLRAHERVGLQTLIEQAELRPDGLTEEHIGFQLAPRLNSLGRLGDARKGVELLLTRDAGRARILAAEMDGLNNQRRLITNQTVEAALTQIDRDPSLLDHRALVLAGHGSLGAWM